MCKKGKLISLQNVKEKNVKLVGAMNDKNIGIILRFSLPQTTVVLLHFPFRTVTKGDSLPHKTKPNIQQGEPPTILMHSLHIIFTFHPLLLRYGFKARLILQSPSFKAFQHPGLCELS